MPEPLPPGAVLLHVGPYKTGSSAIQTALFEARSKLPDHGVAYPGHFRRVVKAGHAVLGWAPRGRKVPNISVWEKFADTVRSSEEVRVCVSSENFGRLQDADVARRIVDDLGGDRVHILVGARSLHRLLPSQWQERVKNHETRNYQDWLRSVLEGNRSDPTYRRFWNSHDIARTARTWLPAVGNERFHVLVVDDDDRAHLFRTFEQLLGLPSGFLVEPSATNPSFSANQLQVLRRLNQVFDERKWPDESYRQLIQIGLIRGMDTGASHPDDRRIPPLPGWAVPKVRELSRQQIDTIGDLGVPVAGDLQKLQLPSDDRPAGTSEPPTMVRIEAMVGGITGLIESAQSSKHLSTRALVRELIHRAGRPVRRRA